MTKNIIISIIFLIILIIYKIIQIKKYKAIYKEDLYKKSLKIIKISYLISVLLFITILVLNLINYGNDPSIKTTIEYIINAISVAILALPLTIHNLYQSSFNQEEKISHKKTIITNEINEKLIRKFNKAGINVVILTMKEPTIKIKTIKEDEIDKKLLSKNIVIKTNNLKLIDNIVSKEKVLYAFDNPENAYNQIKEARGIHDNYIRTIKYNTITYLSLMLSYVFLTLMSFPTSLNLSLVLLLKIFTIITSNFLYKNMPYDIDIMERKVKDKEIFIGRQELLITIIASFSVFFFTTIPYMYTLSQDGTIELANTLFYIIFIYSNIFITYSLISESNIIKNIFKSLTNIRLIIYTLSSIAFTILLNFTTIFDTKNIYLKNYLSCILFAIFTILFLELTKLARFTTVKGTKKNELKNNKKYKRS